MDSLRPVMLVGTCSDAGKSVLTAGLCRVFKQDGYSPAPFKGQNMSNNSFATPDGREIGRAQAVQAEAAGVAPHTDMNPILLKPSSNQTSQLVLNGKPAGNQSAFSYFKQVDRNELFNVVKEAYGRLAEKYSPIVIEGAGSISELNLKARDITNMRVAIASDAATYLVADIDRGGVFGSVYGTIKLLSEEELAQIEGIIINKFRGDIRLFEDGRKLLEEITGVPVVGVVPYFRDIHIEEEDAVALSLKQRGSVAGKVNIAVVLLSRMSNFTDFNALERDPRVHLYYTDQPSEIENADVVILPGTKNTIEDLLELRKKGLASAIHNVYTKGGKVIGICGGYQMMGQEIHDPYHVEGEFNAVPGLGLLPVKTVLSREKKTVQCSFDFLETKSLCHGYEIHMGETTVLEDINTPVNVLKDGSTDGHFLNDRCWGSYMHGIFDNATVVNHLINVEINNQDYDHAAFKEQQYDKLADVLRDALDMDSIYKAMRKKRGDN